MISSLFHSFFYQPLYNGLILLIDVMPWLDAGAIIILFTIIIKLALFPLSRKAVLAQAELKTLEPEINQIKEKVKDKQEQSERIIALYRKNKINPFVSIFLVLVQFPIIFALYFIFANSELPGINTDILYTFIHSPTTLNTFFLGIFDVTQKSVFLAVFVGLSSFFQMKLSLPKPASGSNEFVKSMNLQMRYVMPVMISFFAYQISSAISLYWITSNLFAIGQEMILKKPNQDIPKAQG